MAQINQPEISAEEILRALKLRIYTKLQEDGYEDDMGVWHDPLPPAALGSIGNFVLKLVEAEDKRALRNAATSNVVAIPALPPIQKKEG